MKESYINNETPVSIVKVKYKSNARVVKIPYDMRWTEFESKVCSLFNLTPPITLSYIDSMGVSIIVDTEDDFFFYMDEDFNGRLEVVSKDDDDEGLQWMVVRNDTNNGNLVKENDIISYTTSNERNQISTELCTEESTPLDSPKPDNQQLEELKEHVEISNGDEVNGLGSDMDTSIKSDYGHLNEGEDRLQNSKHSAVNSDKQFISLVSGSDKTSSIFEVVQPYSEINEVEPTTNNGEVKTEVPELITNSKVAESNVKVESPQDYDFESSVTSISNVMVSEQFRKSSVLNATNYELEVAEQPTTLKTITEVQTTTNANSSTSSTHNDNKTKEVVNSKVYPITKSSSLLQYACNHLEYREDKSKLWSIDKMSSNSVANSESDSESDSPSSLLNSVNIITAEDCSDANSNSNFDHAYNELVEAVEDILSQRSSTKSEDEAGRVDQPSSNVEKVVEESLKELDLYNFKEASIPSAGIQKEVENKNDIVSLKSTVLSNNKDQSVNSTEFEINSNLEQFLLLQGVRSICQTNEQAFKTCPSLLILTEILTDQVLHGVPINLEVLQRAITRLNVNDDRDVDKKYPQFDNLPANLLEALNKIIKHFGTSINHLIEKDINPLLKEQFGKKGADEVEIDCTEAFGQVQPCSSSTQQVPVSVPDSSNYPLPKDDLNFANSDELKSLRFDLPALLLGGLSWIDKAALNSMQKLMELKKANLDHSTTTDVLTSGIEPISSSLDPNDGETQDSTSSSPESNDDEIKASDQSTQKSINDVDAITNLPTKPADIQEKLTALKGKSQTKKDKKQAKKARREVKINEKLVNKDPTLDSSDVPVQAIVNEEINPFDITEITHDLNTEYTVTSNLEPREKKVEPADDDFLGNLYPVAELYQFTAPSDSKLSEEKVESADNGFLAKLFPVAELYHKPINAISDLAQNYMGRYDDRKFWGSKPHIEPTSDEHVDAKPYPHSAQIYGTNPPASYFHHHYTTQICPKYNTPNTTYPSYGESSSNHNNLVSNSPPYVPPSPTYPSAVQSSTSYNSVPSNATNQQCHNYPKQITQMRYSALLPEPSEILDAMGFNPAQAGSSSPNQSLATPIPTVDTFTPDINTENLHEGEEDDQNKSYPNEVDPDDAALISGLATLRDMGFLNDMENLEALQANNCNLLEAVNYLLNYVHV